MREQVVKLAGQNPLIIDVRTPGEFQMGANPKSTNIPLDQFEHKISSLDRNRSIILCCASGARSASAAALLKRAGFPNVANAGPWQNTLDL